MKSFKILVKFLNGFPGKWLEAKLRRKISEAIHEEITVRIPKYIGRILIGRLIDQNSWLHFEEFLKQTLAESSGFMNNCRVAFQKNLSNIVRLSLFIFSSSNYWATFTSSVAFLVWNATNALCLSICIKKILKSFNISLL